MFTTTPAPLHHVTMLSPYRRHLSYERLVSGSTSCHGRPCFFLSHSGDAPPSRCKTQQHYGTGKRGRMSTRIDSRLDSQLTTRTDTETAEHSLRCPYRKEETPWENDAMRRRKGCRPPSRRHIQERS